MRFLLLALACWTLSGFLTLTSDAEPPGKDQAKKDPKASTGQINRLVRQRR
jgi:hypothetical protein